MAVPRAPACRYPEGIDGVNVALVNVQEKKAES